MNDNNDNILVSVIVPVYNTGNKLLNCIKSIVDNTLKDIEVIIVDDGSDSKTASLCDSCMHLSSVVKVYHIENKGVSGARNFGINKANGIYTTFVDSDDILHKDALEVMYKTITEEKSDIVVCGHRELLTNGKEVCRFNTKVKEQWIDEDVLIEFFKGNKMGWNVWGKLYKTSIIKDICFPIKYKVAEDMFFLYKVCKVTKKIVYYDVILYDYIDQQESAMADDNCAKFFEVYELIKKVCLDNKKNCNNDVIKSWKEYFYLKNTLWLLKFILGKDSKKKYLDRINNIRIELINSVNKNAIKKLRVNNKIEFYLIKYFYSFFIIYASKVYKRN